MLHDGPPDADSSESRTARAETKFDVFEPVEELLGKEADGFEDFSSHQHCAAADRVDFSEIRNNHIGAGNAVQAMVHPAGRHRIVHAS